ncbi:MAG: phage tail protein [Mixta calida]|uniref:phage tail protein n=1 Tax=Mixta calida TaxID=665913 RepID=UPI0029122C0D|nr:phage tail protein [Mixta calida]MDU4942953.1 phage tail protein [Mixta calida]
MTTKFYALLTNTGAAKFANAAALGTKIQITEMAVGDGGGTLPTPDASQTKLIGEKRRAALNSLSVDAVNSSQIIAEQVIPENEGGFWIREIGLFDTDGDMVAVANCAETYKPQLQEGSGRTQTVRMILIVNSAATVTLKIDPSVVLATRKYVDDKAIEVRAYADEVMKTHLAQKNPHAQYLQIASALAEIKDAGLVADVLKNLGLGEAAKREVGTGANQLPDMSNFKGSLTKNGYMSLPGGLLLQWGTIIIDYSIEHGSYLVPGGSVHKYKGEGSFPIAFPHALMCITATSNDVPNTYIASAYPVSVKGFNWAFQSTQAYSPGGSGSNSFCWFAIGH